MGEPISEGRLKDIVVEGLTDDNDGVKYDAERDPDLSVSNIEVTLRNMYANRIARGIRETRCYVVVNHPWSRPCPLTHR